MPIYSLLCPSCGDKNIMHRKVYERDFTPLCQCGERYERVLDIPAIVPEIPSYISPGTGKLIESRAQRREDLKESRAYEWEPGMERDVARNRVYEQEKAFKPVADAVDQIVTEMNVAGKLETTDHG
jgi:hypothetical protein